MATLNWYKGCLHCHTNRSDGDSDPEVVARWYARNGFHFVVLSDHNHLTILDDTTNRRRRWPLLIPGEEVTVRMGPKAVPIHLNGIGTSRVVEPIDAGDIVSTLQANINAIRQAGGLGEINHPNYQWAFDHTHISQVRGAHFLEVYNAHPKANSLGGGDRPSVEEMWDHVLTDGVPIFAVAVDDAHHFKGDFAPIRANPGRGWVMVRTAEKSQEAVLDALARGDFYASTGVELEELELSPAGVQVVVKQPDEYCRHRIDFIGRSGRLLHRVEGPRAEYQVSGDEGYVRAVVTASYGFKAWTQPVFVAKK